MHHHIIIDRRKKRLGFDSQWNDPLGIEETKKEKIRTIEIQNNSLNSIDKFFQDNTDPKSILGKRVWAKKQNKERFIAGYIVDIYPGRVLLVKIKNENVPIPFSDVISLGE